MNRRHTGLAVLAGLLLAGGVLAQGKAAAEASPHARWDALLRKHVKQGRVSYKGFKADEAALDAYLKYFADTDPAKLSRDEQLAFWINAYNAYTVKLILKSYPGIQSIKDYWGPWDKKDWVVNGTKVTLNFMEHKVLRKMNEPRIHVAINCASVSCPDLLSEAYTAEKLEEQLTRAMNGFLADEKKGMKAVREKGLVYGHNDVVYLSKIFSWFQADFGEDPKAVLRYLEPWMTEQQKTFVKEKAATLKVKFFGYDWNLNGE